MWNWGVNGSDESWKASPYVTIGTPACPVGGAEMSPYTRMWWMYQWNWERVTQKTVFGIQTGGSTSGGALTGSWALEYNNYFPFPDDSKNGILYFKRGSDVTIYPDGTEIHLGGQTFAYGSNTSQHIYIGESDGNGTTGGDAGDYPWIDLTDKAVDPISAGTVATSIVRDSQIGTGSRFAKGKTLFYNPLMHSYRAGIFGDKSSTFTPSLQFDDENPPRMDIRNGDTIAQDEFDPWPVRLRNSEAIIGDKLSDIIRALMGDTSAAVQVPAYRALTWVPFFIDETNAIDFTSLIDYDSMDAIFEHPFGEGQYILSVDEKTNLYNAFASEVLYHRAGMAYEYDAADKRWKIRFRRIGPINVSVANGEGRIINLSNLSLGSGPPTDFHSDEPTYTQLTLKASGREFPPIVDKTTKMLAPKVSNKSIKVEPVISQSATLSDATDQTTTEIYRLYGDGLLRYFTEPTFSQRCELTIEGTYKATLGRDCLVTNPSARDQFTHAQGLTDAAAMVTEYRRDLSRARVRINYKLTSSPVYGWAPAVLVDSAGTIDSDQVDFDLSDFTNNEFSDGTFDRKDIYWFDCINWDPVTQEVSERDCNCGDYRILAIKYNTQTPGTILSFTCSIDLDASTVTFTERVAGHAALWDDTAEYVIIYDEWDDCVSCQKKFVFASDKSNTLGTGSDSPFRWV